MDKKPAPFFNPIKTSFKKAEGAGSTKMNKILKNYNYNKKKNKFLIIIMIMIRLILFKI